MRPWAPLVLPLLLGGSGCRTLLHRPEAQPELVRKIGEAEQREARAENLARERARALAAVEAVRQERWARVDEQLLAELQRAALPWAPNEVAVLFDLPEGDVLDGAAAAGWSAYLHLRLIQAGGLRLVPRSRVEEALKEAKRDALRPCYDETCQIEVGRALAAQLLLAPSLFRAGDTCVLSLVVYDLLTETAVWGVTSRQACDQRALTGGAAALVAAFDRPFSGPPPLFAVPEPEEEEEEPAPVEKKPSRAPFRMSAGAAAPPSEITPGVGEP